MAQAGKTDASVQAAAAEEASFWPADRWMPACWVPVWLFLVHSELKERDQDGEADTQRQR